MIIISMMKIIKIVILTTAVLTIACCKQSAVPKGVIDTATLRSFLTEAYLIEGYSERANRDNRDTIEAQVSAAYTTLLDKYGITQKDYDTTIAYYMRNPVVLKEVYVRVVDDLKALRNDNIGDCGDEEHSDTVRILTKEEMEKFIKNKP